MSAANNRPAVQSPPRNSSGRNRISPAVHAVRRAIHATRRNRANANRARATPPVIYTPDFGVVDLDAELAALDFPTLGTRNAFVKENLGRFISAIKLYFKKLKLIHIVFQVNSNQFQSVPWAYTPPYTFNVFAIDNFGNVYNVTAIHYTSTSSSGDVTVPDIPPGESSKFYVRTMSGNLVDEDAIIASGTLLSDSQITFVKSGIPSTAGTAIAGSDFNESQFRLVFQMLPLLQNVAKETFAVYQAALTR